MDNNQIICVLVSLIIPFGLIGAIMAYMNAYSGWSHFPGITRKKKIAFALEMAGLAILIAIISSVIALYMFVE
jgi:hypothetical protein